MIDKALDLAWLVMEQNKTYSDSYKKACEFWVEFAPISVKGNRQVKIETQYQ